MKPYRPGSTQGSADAATPAPPERLEAVVRAGVLDAELAALVWIMLGSRTPVIVAGEADGGREGLADALAACVPSTATLLPVRADDEFAWLPEAEALGWKTGPGEPGGSPAVQADRATGVLLVRDLADPDAGGPAGDRARLLVRALAVGYGMVATTLGTGLDDMLERLGAPEVGSVEDERSRLGVVLVMAPPHGNRGPCVAAAHYLRPVALDTHGHVHRLLPAVLATWNGPAGRWDHFAWGVVPDLAGRAGMARRDFERALARRAASLSR